MTFARVIVKPDYLRRTTMHAHVLKVSACATIFVIKECHHIIRYRLRSRKLLQIVEPFSVATLLGGPILLERLSSEVKNAMLKGHKACSSEESSSREEGNQVCVSVVNKQE